MAEKETTGTSEAEIAVHWGEENLIHPTTEFIAQANMTDPEIYKRFSLENFPNCFKEYADLLELVRVLAHHPRHQRRPLLEMVRRRQDQRILQLHRPAPGEEQEQDRHPFRPRAHQREVRAHHLPGAVRAGERVCRPAARLRQAQERATGSRCTCPWCRSCRSPCWPAPGWA